MPSRFRRGCPKRPYARFAAQGRPPKCPCCWSDWTIDRQFAVLFGTAGALDNPFAKRMHALFNLFP